MAATPNEAPLAGLGNLGKIPELRKRILFTLGMLIVYRIGAHVPTPGIDPQALATFFEQQQGSLLGMFNMFSGGALSRLTVFALGIMPYISASIIIQLMTAVFPKLEAIKKEGEAGRRKITQYTRYGTIVLALFQGFGIAYGLESMKAGGLNVVIEPGMEFRLMTVLTLTAGTAFLMWVGEQITDRGIGNGISLIIFSGIVANLPVALFNTLQLARTGDLAPLLVLFLIAMAIVVTAFIIFMERAQRRITIQYAKRQVSGRRMVGGESSHLPLKVNTAGVIPPIFASSIILFPVTIANFMPWEGFKEFAAMFSPGQLGYMVFYSAAILFFCFFYTAIVFNPEETADNLRKYGGFIPGIRPGKRTSDYLDKILSRLTLVGAIYVTAVCLLPEILIAQYNVPFYFGGTSMLIVVGVTMDTTAQIQSFLISRQYEGLMKKAKIKGR
ncbi:protein translocase subunit secY/sec61 alpha [Magnetococcus marinus MC-1]|uniref:Protein translocase subunit SecY n=1 Tax=Magnetococcus marinus (strain ATCC BAA-1437 / JCM 17883 / MC-1) TaxID=156889 RepID=A0L5Z3_MAGMM|nr:preprotein translocase subunit SecY [Magnetococcus marinus]ABK43386.1 protein translocase subunit secY/sec61 alpha [Magnetococcus marinus MC-1]